MTLLAAVLAALVGVTLGLFGAGGGALTLPIFVYVLHVDAHAAVPMSFMIVGSSSLVGALARWRAGQLDPTHGLGFGAAAMAGAFVGARVGVYVPARVRLSMFAIAVIASAAGMLRSSRKRARPQPHPLRSRGASYLVFGSIGLLNGIIGIGGGVVFVPALVILCGMPMLEATGISLMIVAMNAAAAVAGSVGQVAIQWRLVTEFTALVTVFALAASMIAPKIPVQAMKRGFAVVLVSVGAFVLYQNLS